MTDAADAMPEGLVPPPGLVRVVVIGSESTGKTELTDWLARAFGVPWSAEYAREYTERRGGGHVLAAADVDPIARGQLGLERAAADAAREAAAPFVLHDTDLLSTEVYATAYYGGSSVPPWLRHATLVRRADLYLFCDTDLPFDADGVRDAAADRAAIQRQFAAALERHGVRHVTIGGARDERRERARAAVREMQKAKRDEPA